jgi:hypothetical protein
VLLTEFPKILKLEQSNIDPLDKYPNIISSSKNVYLKKKHILDNPKNHFILKKLGLLDNYLIPKTDIDIVDIPDNDSLF